MAENEEPEGLWFEDSPAGSSRRVSRRRIVGCGRKRGVHRRSGCARCSGALVERTDGQTDEDRVTARHAKCRRTTTDIRPERNHELR